MRLWSNHPWFVSIVGGLIVAIIFAAVQFIFHPLFSSTVPIVGANPQPSPKTQIEVGANSFEIPGIHSGIPSVFLVSLEMH